MMESFENIRLIMADIDFTLLFPEEGRIAQSTLDHLNRLMDKGISFMSASGRSFMSMKALFPGLDRMYFAGENGAVVRNAEGKLLFEKEFDKSLLGSLLEDFEKDRTATLCICCPDMTYIVEPREELIPFITYYTCGAHEIIKRSDPLPGDIVKLSIVCDLGSEEGYKRYYAKYGHLCNMFKSTDKWVDFTCADKGTALDFMVEYLQIDRSQVMAFGDGENDYAMLKKAGVPVAMDGSHRLLLDSFPRRAHRLDDYLKYM